MPSPIEAPYLCCGGCKGRLTLDNYPLQSLVCGHSICKTCLEPIQTTGGSSSNHNNKYLACPTCKEPRAFHATLSKPNLTAICAIDVMGQYAEILQERATKSSSCAGRASLTSVSSAKGSHQAGAKAVTSSTKRQIVHTKADNRQTTAGGRAAVNHKKKDKGHDNKLLAATTRADAMTPSPAKAAKARHNLNDDSPHGGATSSTESETSEDTLEPLSPPTPPLGDGPVRMVWVKFGKSQQLAYLLRTQGDKAFIRWESQKYEEAVSLDRIEELDSGKVSTKRSRRVSLDNHNNPRAKKQRRPTTSAY